MNTAVSDLFDDDGTARAATDIVRITRQHVERATTDRT
jgi:hypothetical protein